MCVLVQVTIPLTSENGILHVQVQLPSGDFGLMPLTEFCSENKPHADAHYFEELIRLYAALCFDRMYVCKTQVERLIPMEVAFDAVCDKQLPNSIRSAFSDLMLNVYIEVEPQRQQILPEYLRVWDALDTSVTAPSEWAADELTIDELTR